VQKSPATFHLGAGATIEASMSLLGMRRVDLVVETLRFKSNRWLG
jgi:hypothetical protein